MGSTVPLVLSLSVEQKARYSAGFLFSQKKYYTKFGKLNFVLYLCTTKFTNNMRNTISALYSVEGFKWLLTATIFFLICCLIGLLYELVYSRKTKDSYLDLKGILMCDTSSSSWFVYTSFTTFYLLCSVQIVGIILYSIYTIIF